SSLVLVCLGSSGRPRDPRSLPPRRSSDLGDLAENATFEEVCYLLLYGELPNLAQLADFRRQLENGRAVPPAEEPHVRSRADGGRDRKSTRLNSSHVKISYAVFCLKKKRCD